MNIFISYDKVDCKSNKTLWKIIDSKRSVIIAIREVQFRWCWRNWEWDNKAFFNRVKVHLWALVCGTTAYFEYLLNLPQNSILLLGVSIEQVLKLSQKDRISSISR